MLANWVKQKTTSTGTGDITLTSVDGFPTLNNTVGLDLPVSYHILRDSDGEPIEAGIGYLSASATFVRAKITARYIGGVLTQTSVSAVNLGIDDTDGTYRVIFAPLATSVKSSLPGIDSVTSGVKRMVTSRHFLWDSNGDTKGIGANNFFIVPFELDTEMEITRCGIAVATAGAASKIRVGVYACLPNGTPGKKLLETGDIDSTTTGVKDVVFSSSRRLPAGWYYVGILSNVAGVAVRAYQASRLFPTPLGLNASLVPITCRNRPETNGWSSMPETFNMSGSTAILALLDYPPRIALGTG